MTIAQGQLRKLKGYGAFGDSESKVLKIEKPGEVKEVSKPKPKS